MEEKKHVLIVDDNAMVLRSVKALIEDWYSVSVAVSASQAFVSIGRKKPDVILLDYEMPMMNGKEAMQLLQEKEESKDIPIIFLTGIAEKELVQELMSLNPAGYLLKPVDRETLLKLIGEALGK